MQREYRSSLTVRTPSARLSESRMSIATSESLIFDPSRSAVRHSSIVSDPEVKRTGYGAQANKVAWRFASLYTPDWSTSCSANASRGVKLREPESGERRAVGARGHTDEMVGALAAKRGNLWTRADGMGRKPNCHGSQCSMVHGSWFVVSCLWLVVCGQWTVSSIQ